MIPDFIKKYFVDPILHEEGYNVANTTVYAILFILCAYLAYKGLRRMNLKVDRTFLKSIAPYVLVGGVFRTMQDAKLFSKYLGESFIQYFFVTPLIYITVAFICTASLLLSLRLLKENYWKGTAGTAIAISSLGFILLALNAVKIEFAAIFLIPAGLLLSTAIMYYVARRFSWGFITNNLWVVWGQMLDASSTSFGLQTFGYIEQHVIPNFLIESFGTPFIFFPIKMIVVGFVLYILKDEKEEEFRNFILLLVFILGAAPGLRDFLRILFTT